MTSVVLAETGMPTDLLGTALQMGITGIVMICCGVFLHMLLRFYREIRTIEQTHQVALVNNLSLSISQAAEMAKALATAAPLVATVVVEARELVREAKALSESMERQRS
jgi:nitrate reductase beta subunit